jgi:hypothetical protein
LAASAAEPQDVTPDEERLVVSPEPGVVRGRHFSEWVETVKQLKRESRDDEAVALLLELVDATEAEAAAHPGWGVAPWYYEQLAIIYRRRGSLAAELGILERYARGPHAPGVMPVKLQARLDQARQRPADGG